MFKRTKLLTLIALGFIGMGLTACETLDGAGRDIENTGESIQDAAN